MYINLLMKGHRSQAQQPTCKPEIYPCRCMQARAELIRRMIVQEPQTDEEEMSMCK